MLSYAQRRIAPELFKQIVRQPTPKMQNNEMLGQAILTKVPIGLLAARSGSRYFFGVALMKVRHQVHDRTLPKSEMREPSGLTQRAIAGREEHAHPRFEPILADKE